MGENRGPVLRRAAFALLVLLLAVAAGCGRELPEDEPAAPPGGDPTGAFGEPEGGAAGATSLRLAGVDAAVKLGQAAARGFAVEEPETTVKLVEQEVDQAVADALRREGSTSRAPTVS